MRLRIEELSMGKERHSLGLPVRADLIKEQKSRTTEGKYDSDTYSFYRSGPELYEHDFRPVLGNGHLIDFIRNKKSPVVIDFMATTDSIAGLFEQIPHKQKYGLSISLEEDRNKDRLVRDKRLNIRHIAGDLNDFQTWKRIHQELARRKADLIMERAFSGLHNVSVNRRYYAYAVGNIWKMLSSNNGVLVAEVLDDWLLIQARIDIESWITMLNEHNIEAIYKSKSGRMRTGVIKIVKTKNSPEKIPFLS